MNKIKKQGWQIPFTDWSTDVTIVFTDGSEKSHKAGAGVAIKDNYTNTWKLYSWRTQGEQSIERAEWEAVAGALRLTEHEPRVRIIADRESMVNSIREQHYTGKHKDLKRVVKHYSQMNQNTREIMWVKSHIQIEGNEEADIMANQGREASERPKLEVTQPGRVWSIEGTELSSSSSQWHKSPPMDW